VFLNTGFFIHIYQRVFSAADRSHTHSPHASFCKPQKEKRTGSSSKKTALLNISHVPSTISGVVSRAGMTGTSRHVADHCDVAGAFRGRQSGIHRGCLEGHMRLISCATAALAMACSYASVYASGTILLTRPVNTISNGTLMPTGSGLFTVNDGGGHLRQLTPFVSGSYYMPSWVASQNNYRIGAGYWLTTNLSPDGKSVLYFQNPSSDPADGPYSGKYYVRNLATGTIQPLFAGSNDNAAPGYGYLARDPADGNTIAYTNSTSEYPVPTPCVYLMHADGSNQHALWGAHRRPYRYPTRKRRRRRWRWSR
jgi:hypothetical protein